MPCIEDLVYDVGMHNGDDTAYYLHKGYRVLAIEANPALVVRAGRRFATEIAEGRLEILNSGIAATPGEAEFFVSDVDVWSSFLQESAMRDGVAARPVRVTCVRFADVLASHGVPFYLKVDIEGSDSLCLECLGGEALPAYVSVEMSHAAGDRDIADLMALGYSRFKCVRQNDFALVTPHNINRQLALRRLRGESGPLGLGVRLLRRAVRPLRRRRDGNWTFASGSSGPFGAALPGDWLSGEQMLGIWRRLSDAAAEFRHPRQQEWFDVHAAR